MRSIPDSHGERWCHDCNSFLPVDSFPSGIKRYQCIEHLKQRMKCARQAQYERDGESRMATRLHHSAYEDARAVFKQKGISVSQKVLRHLFANAGVKISSLYRIVPGDPKRTLDTRNVIIVQSEVRKKLVKAFIEGGVQQYHEELIKWVEYCDSSDSEEGVVAPQNVLTLDTSDQNRF
jgi:hypothetical protein